MKIIFYLISTAGFGSLLLGDFLQIRPNKVLSFFSSIFGYTCIMGSLFFLVTAAPLAHADPLWAAVTGRIFAGLFFIGLIYTTVYPLIQSGNIGEGSRRTVVDTGLYGVVRHPGFYFFTFLIISIIVIDRRLPVLICGAYLIILDFLLILIQDRVMFPQIFPRYGEYKNKVPFIVPCTKRKNGG